MRAVVAMTVGVLLLVGCGADAKPNESTDLLDGSGGDGEYDEGEAADCVDEDEDGFGEGCAKGEDCDDNDDSVTEQCMACTAVREGCLCEPGAEPVECDLPKSEVPEDSALCKTGLRYCRDGTWTRCEGVAAFQEDLD